MGKASSSSSASTGIQSPGGSIHKNDPGIWITALLAVVALFYLYNRSKK